MYDIVCNSCTPSFSALRPLLGAMALTKVMHLHSTAVQVSAAGGVATLGHTPVPDDAAPNMRPSAKRFELRPHNSSGYCSDPCLRESARQVPAQERVPGAKGCKGLPRFMDKVRARVCLLWTPPPSPRACLQWARTMLAHPRLRRHCKL